MADRQTTAPEKKPQKKAVEAQRNGVHANGSNGASHGSSAHSPDFAQAQLALAGLLLGCASLEEAAPKALALLCDAAGFDAGALWRAEEDGEALRRVDCRGAYAPPKRVRHNAPEGVAGLMLRAWETGASVWSGEEGKTKGLLPTGFAAGIAAPLLADGRLAGMLELYGAVEARDCGQARAFVDAAAGLLARAIVRAAESADLRRSESHYRAVVNNVKEVFFQTDAAGTLTFLNPAWTELTGYTIEESLGTRAADYVQPEDRDAFAKGFDPLLRRKREQCRLDCRILTKDGDTRWVELFARTGGDAQSAATGASGTLKDITERRQAEAELAAANALQRQAALRFQELFQGMPVACFTFDRDGRIFEWNRAGEELFMLSAADIFSCTLWETIYSASSEDACRELIEAVFRGEVSEGLERDFERSDGSVVHLVCNTFPIRGADGSVIGAISTNVDITERKRAEAAMQRAQEELEFRVQERTAELAQTNAALQEQIIERQKGEDEIISLNAELERRLSRIAALRAIDAAITGSVDLRITLGLVLDQVMQQLAIDAADMLICNQHAQMLEYAAGKGIPLSAPRRRGQPVGRGAAGRAALDRRTIHIPDARALTADVDAYEGEAYALHEEFPCYYAVPLIAKGQVNGVLEIYHRTPLDPDAEWLDFLEALAGQAAIAVDNASMFDSLQRTNTELMLAYDATIEGWSRALDMRDKETEGHTQRVTEMTLRLSRAMNLSEAELVHVRRGALLHDIGKMGIPDGILLKPGGLTDEEWEIMRQHPRLALEMLSPIAFLRPALDIPYCHHEKWDGTGYPRGLKGEQIPLTSRIFSVADVWDALRSDRPYRKGWPMSKVREHIGSLAGTHFDPQVVKVFLEITTDDSDIRGVPSEEAA